MTDRQLTAALAGALGLEHKARAAYEAAGTRGEAAEAAEALAALRLVVPVIRSLEQWIAGRAARLTAPGDPAADTNV
jgi:hypothetical protein